MRPSKMTEEIKEKLIGCIKMGLPIKESCNVAGIHESTYFNWKNYAKDDKRGDQNEYIEFFESLKMAESEAQARIVKKLHESNNPTSLQFILERRWPKIWGRRDKVDLGGKLEVTNIEAKVEKAAQDIEQRKKQLDEEKQQKKDDQA